MTVFRFLPKNYSLQRNSFELIFIYSCSICTPRSSCGCFILQTSVRHVVAVKGGIQPGRETKVFEAVEHLSRPLFFQSSSRQSKLPIYTQTATTMPAAYRTWHYSVSMLSSLILKVVLETEGPKIATERD